MGQITQAMDSDAASHPQLRVTRQHLLVVSKIENTKIC
jgi:hypothetical protein